MPDATDRDAPATTSPSVGSTGAGQPADAGPAGGETDLPPDPLDSEGGLTDIAPAAVDLLGDAISPAAPEVPENAAEALARCREALADALELLEGWILTKCPRKFIPEHMAHVAKLRDMGGLPRSTEYPHLSN